MGNSELLGEFMDIGKLLSDLKGKVLDASHFDLLKHAYELQEQNIIQLKSNNDALRESNDLLKEKLSSYTKKIEDLEEENLNLSKTVRSQAESETENIVLSDNAMTILKKIIQQDVTDFYQNAIIDVLGMGRITTQAALDELSEKGLIDCMTARHGYGLHYHLTNKAKKALTGGVE